MVALTITEKCASADLGDAEHTRCVGVVFGDNPWDEGALCQCSCHMLARCYAVYANGANGQAFWCRLHENHGGNFHSEGHILWGVDH